jgi:hypothetical protein
MDFTTPISFREAVEAMARKKLLPTDLSSAELSGLSQAIKNSSFFSARTNIESLLDKYKTGIESIVNPQQVERDGQTVTEGFNPASLRGFIKDYLRSISYKPNEGEEGTIKDLSSSGRINLVVKTNTELAQGAGKFLQGNLNKDVVDLYPVWELVRYEDRKVPRDWEQRWRIAAQVAGDARAAACLELHGRMVALKSSGIWQALGDGAGGYDDALGNPFPPFAFNSGMWTDDVSRADAVDLGLIGADETAKPAAIDFASLFGMKEAA